MPGKNRPKQEATEDEVRFGILRSLYQLFREAGSLSRSRLGIRELKQRVRSLAFKAAQVQRNVDYLVDSGWIATERPPYTGKGGKTYPGKVTYRISAKGVGLFEGESFFQAPATFHGIDIVNVQGIVQVGEANYANAQFQDLQAALEDLRPRLLADESLTLEERVSHLSDILSLQAQLLKEVPDEGILKRIRTRFSGLRARLYDLGSAASVVMSLDRVLELLSSIG